MENNNYKIAVFGAGSMGTVLGAFLSRGGLAVDMISRDIAYMNALKTKGARITGTISFTTAAFDGIGGRGLALLPSEMNQKYNIIFLLTKQIDNTETAEILQNHLEPDGIICTMQNGIPEPLLAKILGEEKVLGCICAWGANKIGPGKVVLTTRAGSLNFGLGCLFNNTHPMLPVVKSVLEKMCVVNIETNFIGARWSKLIINAAFSGLSAISGYNFGKIAAGGHSRKLVLKIFKECINVCNAVKVKIEPIQGKDLIRLFDYNNKLQEWFAMFLLPFAIRKHHAIKSGMLHDLDSGKRCEIEYINGVVSEWGKKHKIPTPYNDQIIEIVHSIERGECKYNPKNLKFLGNLH
ncbi:MAG: ketopantoate reductase family protein [Treponema sp.]|jgi:2-dehydropantoate 2-reductase|nr:ketopantoate reductase family protein [Treponema sp.]